MQFTFFFFLRTNVLLLLRRNYPPVLQSDLFTHSRYERITNGNFIHKYNYI